MDVNMLGENVGEWNDGSEIESLNPVVLNILQYELKVIFSSLKLIRKPY